MSFDFKLANVPAAISVLSVSAVVKTTRTIKSPRDLSKRLARSSISTPLFAVSSPEEGLGRDTYVCVTDECGNTVTPISSRLLSQMRFSSRRLPFQTIPACGSFSVRLLYTLNYTQIILNAIFHIQFSHVARLPNDQILRPSTLKGTKTPLEMKHELIMKLHFVYTDEASDDGDRAEPPYALSVSQPITISSVCVTTCKFSFVTF